MYDNAITQANRDSRTFLIPKRNHVLSQIRKPYTVTKQRERWTDVEHTLFLEALKEHGRQWCKIAGPPSTLLVML